MLEKLLSLDTELFVFLNGLGSKGYDGLWLIITKQSNWIPLFLLLLYVIFKKLGAKQTLYLLFFVAILVTFTDQMTNVFKNGFERLRPCNNPEINSFIRVVQVRGSFQIFQSPVFMAFGLCLQQNLSGIALSSRHFIRLFIWICLWFFDV